jgi:alginate O-acetyltransferase complex protein AlgI
MLFNSFEFLLLFLPVVFFGFFAIGAKSFRLAALWLAMASLFFYGWWNPKFVALLVGSVAFNYGMARAIAARGQIGARKAFLATAIAANLVVLGIFKYTNFFISSINAVAGTTYGLTSIILPLGISFFTFTQIAFLVDVYRNIAHELDFVRYLLFVTYFPHLIAGPVLHHRQMMPQFARPEIYRVDLANVVTGLSIFVVGLAKKVLLADSFADFANPVFSAANDGAYPRFFVAWAGALAYTLQLYFDFSGYSDMAIGLSRMFGVVLPLNFNAPYKAVNIIEFWRRCHMTLSRFLRDYLYVPLGGNRLGPWRRHINLMVTMLLGGLWHGANWTFVVWGGLHGVFLVINHLWRALRRLPAGERQATHVGRIASTAFTFLCVVFAWVFFRADTFRAAVQIVKGMVGWNGINLPQSWASMRIPVGAQFLRFIGLFGDNDLLATQGTAYVGVCLIVGLSIIWLCPTTQRLFRIEVPEGASDVQAAGRRDTARRAYSFRVAVAISLLCALSVVSFSKGSPFLYFQF